MRSRSTGLTRLDALVFSGCHSDLLGAAGAPGVSRPFSPKSAVPNSVSGFRSFHPGVCQFLMADGTVKVLNETIDPVVYVGLSTISGREVLPSDF